MNELQQAIELPEVRREPSGFYDDANLKAGSFPALARAGPYRFNVVLPKTLEDEITMSFNPSHVDRVALFVQYATLLADAGRLNEAQQVLADAKALFKVRFLTRAL